MGARETRPARACGGRCAEAEEAREARERTYDAIREAEREIAHLRADRDRAITEAGKLSAENLRLRGDLATAHQRVAELMCALAVAESRQGVRP